MLQKLQGNQKVSIPDLCESPAPGLPAALLQRLDPLHVVLEQGGPQALLPPLLLITRPAT